MNLFTVVLIDLRNFDARRLIQQGKYDQMVRLYEHMIDRACKLGLDYSEKYKNITRGNVLVNLDGFNPQENSCSACKSTCNLHVISVIYMESFCQSEVKDLKFSRYCYDG